MAACERYDAPDSKCQGFLRFGVVFVSSPSSVQRISDLGYGTSGLEEGLVLLEEESIYLVLKEMLEVIDYRSGEMLSASVLWDLFTGRASGLVARYRVFHFFKEQSFIIRSGINFGVDFCLYRDLPLRCHSEFCVLVVDSQQEPNSMDLSQKRHEAEDELFFRQHRVDSTREDTSGLLGWRQVSSLTRVMPDVMKICLLCYVLPNCVPSVESPQPSNSTPGTEQVSVSPYQQLFAQSTGQSEDKLRLADALKLQVRPVSVLVRRLQVNNELYPRIKDVARKYQRSALLHQARRPKAFASSGRSSSGDRNGEGGDSAAKLGKRKHELRKRRDASEVRVKVQSKSNVIWNVLLGGEGKVEDPITSAPCSNG
jgi:tRNA splicing endonuclease